MECQTLPCPAKSHAVKGTANSQTGVSGVPALFDAEDTAFAKDTWKVVFFSILIIGETSLRRSTNELV